MSHQRMSGVDSAWRPMDSPRDRGTVVGVEVAGTPPAAARPGALVDARLPVARRFQGSRRAPAHRTGGA